MLSILGLILLAGAFAASAVLCAVVRRAALRIGYVDHPGHRKIHQTSTPYGGGIAMFLTVTALVLLGVIFTKSQLSGHAWAWLPQVLQDHFGRIEARAGLVFVVLGGGAVMFLLGLCDDIWKLSPRARLVVQVLVAAVLYTYSDRLRITVFVGSRPLSFLYTVFWIVGITNAFNLLDNMDGLSAGVAAISSAMFLVVAVMTEQYFLAAMLVVLIGALLGFLVWNFPPARMFMGDAGSLFIGYMVSVLTVLFSFYLPGQGQSPITSILAPVVIMAVPVYDTISVVLIRLASGRPIFEGDKKHFSHRLVELGMSGRAAVLTIYLVTLCTGLLAPLLFRLQPGMSIVVLANVALMLLLVWLLEHAGRRGRGNGGEGAR